MNEQELAELQKACDEASPAPWVADYHPCGPCGARVYREHIVGPHPDRRVIVLRPPPAFNGPGRENREQEHNDARLIALARNALPTLLAMHTQDRKTITDLESDLRRLRELVYFAGLHDKLWEEAQVREPGITAEEFQYLVQP